MSLLQFGLDRWWPHVVAMSLVIQLTVISGAGGGSFNSQIASFVPLRPVWHPGGPSGDSGALLSISDEFQDHISIVFSKLSSNMCVFLSCVFTGRVFQ